jgi:hypothetical protein
MKTSSKAASLGGRPRKFTEPSRVITITLPCRTLELLDSLGPDRARAIVKCVDAVAGVDHGVGQLVTLVPIATGANLILTRPSKYLNQVENLRMIEVSPGRYLLSLRPGTSPSSLEVILSDLLETIPASEVNERQTLQKVMSLLRQSRRTKSTSKEEILLVGGSEGS